MANAEARALDWLHAVRDVAQLPSMPPSLVLAADVVWVESLVAPLVAALDALCGPRTVLLLAHQSRSHRSDNLLWGLLDPLFAR